MYEPLKGLALRFLKVPPEPHPPSGSPGSARVFRAGRNYYRYKLAVWGLKQLGAVAGLAAFLVLRPLLDGVPVPQPIHKLLTSARVVAVPVDPETGEPRRLRVGDISGLLLLLEAIGLTTFAAQLPFTYALVRLDFEMRWYIVTDRSLRIREGAWHVSEMTMTFANVQNLTIEQGPIQRLLGIADLHVKTAGGGSIDAHAAREGNVENMHEGYFRGVDNAAEIRDLILALLKRYRGSGLGDPEEARHAATTPAARSPEVSADAVAAAGEVLAEARSLRRALGRGTGA